MRRALRRLFGKEPVKKPIDYKTVYALTIEGVRHVIGEIQPGLEFVERDGKRVFASYNAETSRWLF